ncbi:MAG: hypothetical protein Q8O16_06040 [Dehalococcoidia bacterium]|nr:hypothetical protein [Dehalococcoidia bacterium]
MIRDATGSIYVNGSSLGLRYPANVGTKITVEGTVRLKNGLAYIEIAV